MPMLYVRGFPEGLHDELKARAARNHRSVSAEIVAILKHALADDTSGDEARRRRLEALLHIIERSEGYVLPPGAPDSVTLLREDRDR